ncbi:MAG: phosphatase PAP2 family protein [Christensenellales bacterium]|jgi:membrane-associated phospholipid phosphatase
MAFDHLLMKWIQALGGKDGTAWQKIMDFFFSAVTFMGEELFLLLGIFIIYWGLNKKFGEYLVITLFATIGTNGLLKAIFKRPRPFLNDGFSDLRHVKVDNFFVNTTGLSHSYSFPSGHSQLAGSLFTATALYYRKRPLTIIMAVLIVLMMMSRVYLGVHYPTDVIAGGLIGVGVALGMYFLLKKFSNAKIVILLSLFALVIITLIYEIVTDATSAADTAKMAGLAAGAIAGFIIESKYIDFKVDGSFFRRAFRVLIGFGIVMGVRLGFKAIFGVIAGDNETATIIFDTIRYSFMGIVATAVWPLIFMKIKL